MQRRSFAFFVICRQLCSHCRESNDDVESRVGMEFDCGTTFRGHGYRNEKILDAFFHAICWQCQYKKEFVMKRFWYTWLVAIAAMVMVGTANAQNDVGGSIYQNVLSSAGYRTNANAPAQDAVPAPGMAAAMESAVDLGQAMQPAAGEGVANSGACNSGACDVAVAAGSGSNWVVGVSGLYFTRDSEDDVRLTRNGAGEILLSTDANMNTMGGVEFDLTKRNCNGNGFQFVYWGLYPGEAFQEISGPGLSTYQTGLANVAVAPGAQDLQTYFDNADSNYAYRTNEIHNIEANFLRNGGTFTTRRGRAGTFELLGGFRWFQFNENFGYGAFSAAGDPTAVEYDIDVENTLLGFQVGGRTEFCLSDRLSASIATKLGFFNNGINHEQNIATNTGAFAYRTAAGVDDYGYVSDKNDFSMLGEFDMGTSYRMSCNSRIRMGYRVIGISGIALAPNQIPNDFTLDPEINAINSNGDLILGGGYAGLEFCF
jgi:hypothetical protein